MDELAKASLTIVMFFKLHLFTCGKDPSATTADSVTLRYWVIYYISRPSYNNVGMQNCGDDIICYKVSSGSFHHYVVC